jgi:hypothetical protein
VDWEVSSINYEVGRKVDKNGVPITHTVDHIVEKMKPNDADTQAFLGLGSGGHFYSDYYIGSAVHINACRQNPNPYGMSYTGTHSIAGDVDWVSLKDAFYEACDTYLQPSFLIGEDIAESDVFVEAFKTILNPSRAVRNLVKFLKPHRLPTRSSFGDAVAYARKLSDASLSYNFGIKPAIEDVKSLLDAHKSVRDKLRFLRENKGKFVRFGVKQKHKAYNAPNLPSGPYTSASDVYKVYDGLSTNIGRISAYGRVRNDINTKGDWTAYAQYFGIEHIVGLAWELIPYSFLVDWVTNAQERLRNLTRLHFGGPFSEITGLSASLKETVETSVIVTPGYIATGWYNRALWFYDITKPFPVAYGHFQRYRRWLLPPDESTIFTPGDGKFFHFLTGGSLLVQKLTGGYSDFSSSFPSRRH